MNKKKMKRKIEKYKIVKYSFYGMGTLYAIIQFMEYGLYTSGDNMQMLIISILMFKIGLDIRE